MGRLRTLTTLLILGTWGATTDGAPPESAAPSPSPAARPPAPAPPIKYLEAGTRLFNQQQYPLAGKYLNAAQTYRDQLTASQQTVLDAYLSDLAKVPAVVPAPAAAETDPTPAVATATADAVPTTAATVTASPSSPAPASPRGPSTDVKQTGRWLLQAAREQVRLGNYDAAAAKVEEVRALNVHWGLFDDTPAKVAETIAKARPQATAPATATAAANGPPKDRRIAKTKLKEARAALANSEYEKAESIALDIKSWNLNYGFFDDNPDKVAAAARALRRRDKLRNANPTDQPSQSAYELLVQESRKLMTDGKWDAAEAKARQAQRMNVVPALTSDRADSVLHELAMARARQAPGAAVVATAEPASVVAEREANALLAKGDNAAASAKFAEADSLKMQEEAGAAKRAATADPSVQKVEGSDAGPNLTALPAPAIEIPAQPPVVAAPAATPVAVVPTPAPAPVAEAAPAPAPAPAAVAAPAVNPAPVNRGEQLLAEAKALYASGNYPAAKQKAAEAKDGKFGVDAQADDLASQIALAEQGGALSLYESALDALRKGDHDRARALLTEVATSGATLNEGLVQKVQDLLTKLGRAGAAKDKDKEKDEVKDEAGKAIASDLKNAHDAETLAAQKLNAEVGARIADARRYQETDPDKALAIYEDTLKTVKAADIPEALARTMARRLEVALELAKKDKAAFDVKMQDKAARAEIELKKLRIFEADKAKKDRMKDLMEQASKAMSEGRFVEAEAFAKKAQEIDPNDVTSTIVIFKAKMERRLRRELENRDKKENDVVETFQAVDEASQPDADVQRDGIKYPKSFKDLTDQRRKKFAQTQPRKSPRTLAIEQKLNDSVTLNLDNQPLAEAIGFLANYTGLNIVVDPKALNEENITTATPVSLVATNIRLKTALKLLLKPMGLTYHIEDEVLLITSPQMSQSQTYPWAYYVGDLAMSPPTPVNPTGTNVQAQTASSLQAQAAALSSSAPAGANLPGATGGMTTGHAERPKTDMAPLIQLITSSIAPGTWRVHDDKGSDVSAAYGMGAGFGGGGAGGADGAADNQAIGSITPFFLSISLIIRHTGEIHEQIADLLRQLRRLQDLQVSIEVRFITVSDNFFEQIGVDFDMSLHSNTVGRHSSFAIPNPATFPFPNGSGTTAGATGGATGGATAGTTAGSAPLLINPFRDNTFGNRQPLVVGTSSPGIGNFTPDLQIPFTNTQSALATPTTAQPGAGATLGIAFLSDLEVYLFLTAAQGDTRSNVLQAPKVTTFNGALAFITDTVQTTYISQSIPIVGFGAIAYQPIPAQFPSGVQLVVTPVVSADRRYVRMTLQPNFNVLQALDTIQQLSGGASVNTGAVGGSGLGGGGAVVQSFIQLPRFQQTTVTTTVTVPDGGTVLLGGVKRLNEQRNEFGVPILAKTPWINRLFRNVGISRDTSSLMLMVTPRIVILEEEEEKLGIPTTAL